MPLIKFQPLLLPIDLTASSRIVARVKEQPGETWQEIADYIEGKPSTVRSSMSKLVNQNLVRKVGNAYYPVKHGKN